MRAGLNIESIPAPDGIPRHLVPRIVAVGSDTKFDMNQVLALLAEPR